MIRAHRVLSLSTNRDTPHHCLAGQLELSAQERVALAAVAVMKVAATELDRARPFPEDESHHFHFEIPTIAPLLPLGRALIVWVTKAINPPHICAAVPFRLA